MTDRTVDLDKLYPLLFNYVSAMMIHPDHEAKGAIFQKALERSYARLLAESEQGSISLEAVEEVKDLQFEICGWADTMN